MTRAATRLLALLLGLALVHSAGFAAPPAVASPAQQSCPNRVTPPSTVSSPDQHPPAAISTEPLPVPDSPVGGDLLGQCGLVLPKTAPDPPEDITAKSWVIQDLDNGDVLAARAPHARHRPASLIKLLLALVVVDHFDSDDEITPTTRDAEAVCSCVGLSEGEQYTVNEVLHGLLMVSGNDAAHALGTALGGQQRALRLMNERAAQLGALDTRATSTSGLDSEGMVSSAYDLSIIYNTAMRSQRIARIVGTKKFTFPGKNGEEDYPLRNDNKLLGSYAGFLGGKTGFTDNAQHTYAGGAQRDGARIGVVLLRGKQRPDPLATQAGKLLDYGFRLAGHHRAAVGTVNGRGDTPPTSSESSPEGDEQHAGTVADSSDSVEPWMWITGALLLLLLTVALATSRRQRMGHRRFRHDPGRG